MAASGHQAEVDRPGRTGDGGRRPGEDAEAAEGLHVGTSHSPGATTLPQTPKLARVTLGGLAAAWTTSDIHVNPAAPPSTACGSSWTRCQQPQAVLCAWTLGEGRGHYAEPPGG